MTVKKNSVRTHKKIASKAAKVLKSKKTSKAIKQIAASALSNRKRTNKK